MLSFHEQNLIVELSATGTPAADIARRLHCSLGSVRKYRYLDKKTTSLMSHAQDQSPTHIQAFQSFIDHEMKGGVRNSAKLFRTLKLKGYMGSYTALNQYVRSKEGKKKYKIATKVETLPGEQAQVDWGTFGTIIIDGQREKLHAFVYILSYSRMLYVEFAVHQNQQVLQRAHINAFEQLGIPQVIRYDNMKTVVLSRRGKANIEYNPAFIDFARYYKFTPEACPPYWPRAKGKVEAAVKYLRNNFMDGMVYAKSFHTLEEINLLVKTWLKDTANSRIHRTTQRRPIDLWQDEKAKLKWLDNIPQYNVAPIHTRRSTKDALVQYRYNLYAVPSQLAQKKLYLREVEKGGQQYLEIYYKHRLYVRHKISLEKGKWIMGTAISLDKNLTIEAEARKNEVRQKLKVQLPKRDLTYYDQITLRSGYYGQE